VTQVAENVNLNNYVAAGFKGAKAGRFRSRRRLPSPLANGNITEIEETWNSQDALTNTFEYDFENRLIEHDCASVGVTVEHKYDGLGRLLRTDRTVSGPTTTTFEHVRDGLKVVGNIDATNTNIAPTWTNRPNALKPVESQQLQTNSAVQFINVSDEIAPARRTYNPSTSAAGDTSAIASKGRLVLVNGALPATQGQTTTYPSELFSQRNMTYNENSIALSSDRGTLELSGVNLMYEGTRVKSWLVGRDLNPGGRGYGNYYPNGMFAIGNLRPRPTETPIPGFGNSVNNFNIKERFAQAPGVFCGPDDIGDCVLHPWGPAGGMYCFEYQCEWDASVPDSWIPCHKELRRQNDYWGALGRQYPGCFSSVSSSCLVGDPDYPNKHFGRLFTNRGFGPECPNVPLGAAANAGGDCDGDGESSDPCEPGLGGEGVPPPPGTNMPGPDFPNDPDLATTGVFGPLMPGIHYYGTVMAASIMASQIPIQYRGFKLYGCRNCMTEVKEAIDTACRALNRPDCMDDAPKTKECMQNLCNGRAVRSITCRYSRLGTIGGDGVTWSTSRNISILCQKNNLNRMKMTAFHEMYHSCDSSIHAGLFTSRSREARAYGCTAECLQGLPASSGRGSEINEFIQGDPNDCCDPPSQSTRIPEAGMPGPPSAH